MRRELLEGFSIELPDGWSELIEEATYVDAEEEIPVSFASSCGFGLLRVSLPEVDDDEPTMRELDMEALALDWGERRGVAPIVESHGEGRHRSIATAVYRCGNDFVQVWFMSNGHEVIHASYTCPWQDRYEEQTEREKAVFSLDFAEVSLPSSRRPR